MAISAKALVAGAAAPLLAFATLQALAQTYLIDAHIVSAGSSVRSANACFRLEATIAEPVAGYSSSADYSMSAGFRALPQTTASDDLFFSGFEACTP